MTTYSPDFGVYVTLPAYIEEGELECSLSKIDEALFYGKAFYHGLIIDDGSTAGTFAQLFSIRPSKSTEKTFFIRAAFSIC